MAELLFVRTRSVSGWFIRAITGDRFDHIAVRVGVNVYEVWFDHLVYVPYHEYKPKIVDRLVLCDNTRNHLIHGWLSENEFRPYDFIKTLSWPARKWLKLNSPHAINCVEMAIEIMLVLGYIIKDKFNYKPKELYEEAKRVILKE